MGSFFAILAKVMMVLPAAVQTVEALYNHKDSMTKKEMAHAAVVSAAGISEVFTNPEQKEIASAVAAVVNNGIDLTVQAANTVGKFTHKSPDPDPAAPAGPAPIAVPVAADAAAKVSYGPGLSKVVPA